jgi:hypothetical protein
MRKALLTTVVSGGLLAAPAIVGAAYGQQSAPAKPATAQVSKKSSPKKVASNRSRGRRRARNTAIGGVGGAAAGALIGGGTGARTGAVVGGAAGALRPTRRR